VQVGGVFLSPYTEIVVHPKVLDKDEKAIAYFSNAYLVEHDGATPLSKIRLDPIYVES
jgi:hypothetical protein